MIRYVFIFSFFSLVISEASFRFNQDIPVRDYFDLSANSYRDESELLQFIESTMETYSIL